MSATGRADPATQELHDDHLVATLRRAAWCWLWVVVTAVVGTSAGSLIRTGALEPVLAVYHAAVFLWWPAVGGIVVALIASAVRRDRLPSWVHVAVPVLASAAWAGVGTREIGWTVALAAPVLVAAGAAALGATCTEPRKAVAVTVGGVAAAAAITALLAALG